MQALMPDDPRKVGEYSLLGRLGQGPRGTTYLGRIAGPGAAGTPGTEAGASTTSPAGTAPPAGENSIVASPDGATSPAGKAASPDGETGTAPAAEDTGPLFVVRLLSPRPGADGAARGALLDELSAARRVSGAHAVRVVDAGWVGDRPYVVREHVEGRSLRQTVEAGGPLAGDALERVAVGALTALTAVHLAGLSHGALTPGNVLLTPDGPRVADFGLPSPGGATASGQDDLHAWATTLAYAATGTLGLDLAVLPVPLRDVVSACLSPDPAARPTAQGAMLWLLGQERNQLAVAAPQVTPVVTTATVVPAQEVPAQVWGAPALPTEEAAAEAARTVPGETSEPAPAVARRKIGGRFPVGLAAGLGLVVGLSGLGLWGAGHYAAPQQIGRLAAEGDATGAPAAADGAGSGVGGTGVGGTSAPRAQVTVPWAVTPGPQETGVYPLDIGDDPVVPTLSPGPQFTPPAVPTTVPTTATPTPAPTVTVTTTPTVTPSGESTPSATPSLDTPTPTPSGTAPPSGTPSPSGAATPTASGPVTPAPNPSRTAVPGPTVTPRPTVTRPVTPRPTGTTPPRVTPRPSYSLPRTQPLGTNPYNPQRICNSAGKGTGFGLQRSSAFTGGVTYQFYDAATGANCVVTMKTSNIGTATPVSATLEVQGQAPVTDKGSFSYYAGPVILTAKGKCVRFTGTAGTASTSVPFGNCG
ncbi:hypothetical protein ABGB17_15990 [Sphaerisporangium sp. B11E5]|uniref:serine/threonine protein kinase n=1 Tax=Sphaerisporangium sp. B11E5 TaxID=3153563 RepID=UPI00325ED6EC